MGGGMGCFMREGRRALARSNAPSPLLAKGWVKC